MENLLTIFLFISIFLFATAGLYIYMLRDKEVEKRLSYYLDIENRFKERKSQNTSSKDLKDFLKNSNEYIREIMKRGMPAKDQKRINQQLIAAGVSLKPEEFIAARAFFAVVTGLMFQILFKNAIFLLIGVVLGAYLPKIWLSAKRQRRVDKFNDGLADMITTIVGSLRAGYSFSQALKTVSEESESPIKEEIQTLLNELNYGISLEEALNNLKTRMPSVDLELMIHAILIQRQIGGNLSLILEIIVNTIRERKKLQRHVRTLTAQGRLSGRVIAGLPVVIFFIMFSMNRDIVMEFLYNRTGQIAIGIGVVMCLIGFFTMNRITKIEV